LCVFSKKLVKGDKKFWVPEEESDIDLPRHSKEGTASFEEKQEQHSGKGTPPVLVHEAPPEHEAPTHTHSPV
jgi:hypothetical protein